MIKAIKIAIAVTITLWLGGVPGCSATAPRDGGVYLVDHHDGSVERISLD